MPQAIKKVLLFVFFSTPPTHWLMGNRGQLPGEYATQEQVTKSNKSQIYFSAPLDRKIGLTSPRGKG